MMILLSKAVKKTSDALATANQINLLTGGNSIIGVTIITTPGLKIKKVVCSNKFTSFLKEGRELKTFVMDDDF